MNISSSVNNQSLEILHADHFGEQKYKNNSRLHTTARKTDNTRVESQKVLSKNEQTSLHMLFGSDRPEDMNLYGHQLDSNIHKGQFLDLKG